VSAPGATRDDRGAGAARAGRDGTARVSRAATPEPVQAGAPARFGSVPVPANHPPPWLVYALG